MEPLAASSSTHGIRPVAAAVQPELSQVLRDGRVLTGSVLSNPGDGTLMLALGRHRVPAETNLRMDPGDHFFARVEEGPGGIVLRLLGGVGLGESHLLGALRAVIGEDRPVGQLLQELAGRLRSSITRGGKAANALEDLLTSLQRELVDGDADGESLRKTLQGSALRYEAALLSAARGGAGASTFAAIAAGLKGKLLELLDKLEDGPIKEAVARALSGLEAEQLLNAARRESGDPLIWSFPFADGSGWTTARLAIHEQAHGADEEDQQGVQRLVLGVSFSRLGPIRADLVRGPERTTVRLLVEREDVAERLSADAEELARRLGDGQREVVLQARVGTPAELALERQARDVRYLRDHHVMDVNG